MQKLAETPSELVADENGPQLLPREKSGLEQQDAALDRLAAATPEIKKNLLRSCVQVVGADGAIQEREAELLLTIADTLDYPTPPCVTREKKSTQDSQQYGRPRT